MKIFVGMSSTEDKLSLDVIDMEELCLLGLDYQAHRETWNLGRESEMMPEEMVGLLPKNAFVQRSTKEEQTTTVLLDLTWLPV